MQQHILSQCNSNLALSSLQKAYRPFCARAGQAKPRDARKQSLNRLEPQRSASQDSNSVLDSSSQVVLARRGALVAVAAVIALPPLLPLAAAADEGSTDLQEFRNTQQGYRLQRPAAWAQTSKAGADALFEDPARKSSTLGVTVSPIRVDSLDAFGDLDAVASRLLQAEKAKESTTGVQLLRQEARKGAASGVTIYDFEYELDSTRGKKRILNTVAIAGKRLYIVNGAAKCEGGVCDGAAEEAAALMRRAAATFDTL
mmetsp:Transcript_20086/g.60671  ORF Transcript_20086/g.60671 Transcript_20086/m.60671 type:complete len:257 (-) Transcript_20086:232-1002(-)|eukprot:CAMPEP_0206144180 /NCGR_PEP_ID=MMETSP1473-20131121/23282_1 /ASSEMBLY_ACC=CAM_ASM_001109 /TAXON_ID=1461547 /ORGANISM="Stichococcus sp, Strain RCC1054" /LENGTH=256 /DNA_ID=CAMNT_0053539923 /DNA_START=31 /DNA_END=801 /DNA_ORIENTATION=-